MPTEDEEGLPVIEEHIVPPRRRYDIAPKVIFVGIGIACSTVLLLFVNWYVPPEVPRSPWWLPIWLITTAFMLWYLSRVRKIKVYRAAAAGQHPVKTNKSLLNDNEVRNLIHLLPNDPRDPASFEKEIFWISRRQARFFLYVQMIGAAIPPIVVFGVGLWLEWHLKYLVLIVLAGLVLLWLTWLSWSCEYLIVTDTWFRRCRVNPASMFFMPDWKPMILISHIGTAEPKGGFWGNMLGYGTITVESPSQNDAAFRNITGVPQHELLAAILTGLVSQRDQEG
jgi:hypothetical protein